MYYTTCNTVYTQYTCVTTGFNFPPPKKMYEVPVSTKYHEKVISDLHRAALGAIDNEPELPGDPPDELKQIFRELMDTRSMSEFMKVLRLTVSTTKEEIRQRYLETSL